MGDDQLGDPLGQGLLGLLLVAVERVHRDHDVGDLAILHVARLLADTVRRSDIVGRLGGDEFMILLPETDLDKATILGERLCAIACESPLITDRATLPISLSIGAAEASLSQADVAVLMKRADEGLYLAKRRGRNQVAAVARPRLESSIAAE